MGMQLQSTKTMGDFEVEMRSKSFYIHQDSICLYPTTDGSITGSIEIDYNDIPKIKAAIALVERNRP